MWSKSLAGFFLGLLLTISLLMNLDYLTPLADEVIFLVSYVGGFLLWGAIMTVFYCVGSIKKLLIVCVSILLGSASINTIYYLGIV